MDRAQIEALQKNLYDSLISNKFNWIVSANFTTFNSQSSPNSFTFLNTKLRFEFSVLETGEIKFTKPFSLSFSDFDITQFILDRLSKMILVLREEPDVDRKLRILNAGLSGHHHVELKKSFTNRNELYTYLFFEFLAQDDMEVYDLKIRDVNTSPSTRGVELVGSILFKDSVDAVTMSLTN